MGEFWRLVGATILGALISFGTTFFFERRKEQRTERAENRERDRQLQQAARLVWEELLTIKHTLIMAIEDEKWWTSPPYELEQKLWLTYQPTPAALLDSGVWDYVRSAYSTVFDLNAWLGMGKEGRESWDAMSGQNREAITGSDISKVWRADLVRTANVIEVGLKVLSPVARPGKPYVGDTQIS